MNHAFTAQDGITYTYNTDDHGNATITSISPCSGDLVIPEVLGDGITVTAIGRKCCLGAGRLLTATLPQSVTLADDWAFAGCRRLREVRMPRTKLGAGVFQDCDLLRVIRLGDNATEDTGALLAALSQRKDAAYLTDLREAGSEEWYRRIDMWLEKLLEASDQEGYSGQVPCGEEDYGSSDVGAYESGRRREKCELALLRLIHPYHLAHALEQRLKKYALTHTAGSEDGDECWQVILHRHPEERKWYEKFAGIGAFHPGNRDLILSATPEEYVEMRSFFINSGQGDGAGSFLAGLAL